MTCFCGCGGSYNICGSSDRGCGSTAIRTHGQCPCDGLKRNTHGCGQCLDDRYHSCREGNVVDECRCNTGYPDYNCDHDIRIAFTYLSDEVSYNLQYSSLFQTTYNNKKSDEEEECLIIKALHNLSEVLEVGKNRKQSYEYTDESYGKPCASVGDQKNYCDREDKGTYNEALLICDCRFRIRQLGVIDFIICCSLDLLMEYKIEVNQSDYQTNCSDKTSVGQEIEEGISQSCSNNDVGGITTHSCRSTKICTEDLSNDIGNRIKLQKL